MTIKKRLLWASLTALTAVVTVGLTVAIAVNEFIEDIGYDFDLDEQ